MLNIPCSTSVDRKADAYTQHVTCHCARVIRSAQWPPLQADPRIQEHLISAPARSASEA